MPRRTPRNRRHWKRMIPRPSSYFAAWCASNKPHPSKFPTTANADAVNAAANQSLKIEGLLCETAEISESWGPFALPQMIRQNGSGLIHHCATWPRVTGQTRPDRIRGDAHQPVLLQWQPSSHRWTTAVCRATTPPASRACARQIFHAQGQLDAIGRNG